MDPEAEAVLHVGRRLSQWQFKRLAVRCTAGVAVASLDAYTDPRDQVANREHQDTFIEDLEQAGGHIDRFYVRARDEKHHGVTDYAIFVAAGCMRGKSYEQIVRDLDEQVAQKIKARRKAKVEGKAVEPDETAR
jgi:hypothetical protein